MNYFTSLLLTLIIISTALFAQDNTKVYSEGMKSYYIGDYSYAIGEFEKLVTIEDVDAKLKSSAKFFIGESLLGLEQIDGAISVFEEFIFEYPTSNLRELALYRLGNLFFEKKLYDESRAKLIELVNGYPSSEYNGSAYHLIGETFIEEDDLNKAEKFFTSAVSKNRNNSLVDHSIFSLANLYEEKGQYNEAVKYYDKLLGYHKGSELAGQAQLRIGICYYQLKEYDNSVLELSDPLIQELDIDQQNEADYILANAFYSLKEYQSATEAYKRILKNSPTSEMLDRIRYGLAWIHFQQKNYNDAYKMFSVLANSPEDSIAVKSLYWSAESKRYDGKFGEAIDIHKKFVKKYPNHPYSERVLLNVGISKFSQNSFTESEEALLEATSSKDRLTKAKSFTLLGELNLRNREYKTAADYFERGLQIPDLKIEIQDRCKLGLGVANFFMKDHLTAIENFSDIDHQNTDIEKDKLYFYRGEANFYLGDYDRALKNYNMVVSSDNTILKNTTYGKAYSYFNQKDFIKAAHFFTEFLNDFGSDKKALECQLRLADCYYGSKSYTKASTYYEKVLIHQAKFQNDERSFFNYAQSLFKQGSSSQAISVLNDLQLKFPTSKYSDDSQYLIGWIYFQNADFSEAINSYSKLFSNYPNSPLLPIAYYSIGDSYFNIGEYPKAIENYNLLIQEYPNTPYVYDAVNGIQYCYIVQERQNDALNYLTNFIENNENSEYLDKVQFKKGEIYYSSGEYSAAINEYEILVDNYSDSKLVPTACYWMGKSAVLLENFDDAEDYFKTVLDFNIDNEIAFGSILELGKVYRTQEDFSAEVELYDEVLPEISNPKRISEINYVKAQNFIAQENIAGAYEVLNQIVNQRDGSLFQHKAEIELAVLEISRSSYEGALYLLNDVVNSREDDIAAQAQYYIGYCYFEQEKLPEAITALKKVRSLYSAYSEWYIRGIMLLGDCYVKINDKPGAAEMYKAVLKRHRNDAIAKEAQEKLNQL